MTLLTSAGIAVGTLLPFTSIGNIIGLHGLTGFFFAILAATLVCYMGVVTLFKHVLIKRYGELL